MTARAGLVDRRRVTSWMTARDSVEIMGGEFDLYVWMVVVDESLANRQTPVKIPEFINAISTVLLE